MQGSVELLVTQIELQNFVRVLLKQLNKIGRRWSSADVAGDDVELDVVNVQRVAEDIARADVPALDGIERDGVVHHVR